MRSSVAIKYPRIYAGYVCRVNFQVLKESGKMQNSDSGGTTEKYMF